LNGFPRPHGRSESRVAGCGSLRVSAPALRPRPKTKAPLRHLHARLDRRLCQFRNDALEGGDLGGDRIQFNGNRRTSGPPPLWSATASGRRRLGVTGRSHSRSAAALATTDTLGPVDSEKPRGNSDRSPTRAGSTGLLTGLLFAPLDNEPRAFSSNSKTGRISRA
jgi:hypothetical protein